MTLEQELNELRAAQTEVGAPEQAASPSLSEMNKLAEEIAKLRDEETIAATAKKNISAKLEAKEKRVVELLMENSINSYKAPDGLLSLSFRMSAKLPVGPAKTEFYDYLKAQGRFEEMATVHSATFNAFVKEQYELAQEQGKDEPSIPGVTEVKTSPTLSFRRTR